ncbi:MAG: metallophosphoesterase family protein [Deltaproteobacteria bacterium]|nr:metallophosphoesterase family protein [Deltaproteobacteria bacterium]
MRFGLIGDVHAEDERLRVAIDAITAARVDHILCTGDLVDGHGDADKAIAQLASRGVLTIRGNHDRWIKNDEMRTLPNAHRMTSLAPFSIEFLKTLEPTRSFEVPGGKLLLCHGVGRSDMRKLNADDSGYAISSNDELLEVLFDPKIVIMACGHTHKPMVRRFERGAQKPALVVVNAGTLAREDGAGFVILDLAAKRADFFHIHDDLSVKASSRAVL